MLSVILGFLPSLAWLAFFLKEDIHPEPKKIIAKTFAAGGLVALIVAVLQFPIREFFDGLDIERYGVVSLLTASAIEEVFKFSAVYLTVGKSRFLDEPIDAMIYMIAAALGFAFVENAGFLVSLKEWPEIFTVLSLRFAGATLLHSLSSGLVGYYWAKGGRIFIFKGLILASLLHAAFNRLIILFGGESIYPIVFLVIAALFIFWDFEKIKSNHEFRQPAERISIK